MITCFENLVCFLFLEISEMAAKQLLHLYAYLCDDHRYTQKKIGPNQISVNFVENGGNGLDVDFLCLLVSNLRN